jgi:hypothetical protein
MSVNLSRADERTLDTVEDDAIAKPEEDADITPLPLDRGVLKTCRESESCSSRSGLGGKGLSTLGACIFCGLGMLSEALR